MTGKNQHVMPHEGKWAVQGEGNRRVTSIHNTQAAATDRAREIGRLIGRLIGLREIPGILMGL